MKIKILISVLVLLWLSVTPTFTLSASSNVRGVNIIDAGIYNLSFQVWLNQTSTITQLFSYLKDPWLTQSWDLSAIEKGKWVKLQKEITIETSTADSEMLFFVPNQAEAATETGGFYIDDIVMEKIGAITHVVDTFDNIIVYPNPVIDFLKIKLSDDSKINIYSVTGQLLDVVQMSAGEVVIPMSDYKSGFYIVEINSTTTKISRKILKN